uniref:Mevalonate kinase n=1 Tax=Schistocephalus solidus TaxID=70667 RepID=A0A0X3PWH3_SCHSO
MELQISAPGKVILFGEHAVVYGYPAIAASIDLRVRLSVSVENPNDAGNTVYNISLPDLNSTPMCLSTDCVHGVRSSLIKNCNKPQETVREIMERQRLISSDQRLVNSLAVILLADALVHTECCCDSCPAKQLTHPLNIRVTSDLPIGAGLGSSAAFCTVICACFLHIHGQDPSKDFPRLERITHETEKIMHALPSGVDTAISVRGGIIRFQRLNPSPRCVTLPVKSGPLLLIDTRIPRSTADVVLDIATSRSTNPQKHTHLMEEIASVCIRATDHLCNGEMFCTEFYRLVSENQNLLEQLGVSHPIIDDIVRRLAGFGVSAKLTGAGRGGCVIAFLDKERHSLTQSDVSNLLKPLGVDVFVTKVCVPGVQIEVNRLS